MAPVYYLCGYLPTTEGSDMLSEKILRFKSNHYPTKKFWLNSALNSFNELLSRDDSDLLVRSLSHDELKVNLNTDFRTPLGYLCARTAKLLRSRYAAGMICKTGITPPLKGLSRDERQNAVKDIFKVADGFNRRRFKQFWFVDDVITTGATARAVWKALLEFYPDIDFRVFALARTIRDVDFNKDLTFIDDWNRIKDDEYLVIYEPAEEYEVSSELGFVFPSLKFDNDGTFFV